MTLNSNFTIVIAGGGFCGMMALVQLIRKTKFPSEIILINKGYSVACGIAFQSYTNSHLLNVEGRNMSAFPDDPDHFVNWIKLNYADRYAESEIPTTYFPRNLYGYYLQQVLNQAMQNAPDHLKVRIVQDEITAIVPEYGFLRVDTLSKNSFRADKIILATGNSEPGPPLLKENTFLQSKNYYSNPWTENAVLGLQHDDTVLIIGNGLTMVDVVIGLRDKNFTGNIISLSPRGFNILPHRKAQPQKYILDDLQPPYSLDHLFLIFHKHIRRAHENGMHGETVVDAMRAKTQEIWQQLSLPDKRKFMTHLRHLWGVARHRLPETIYNQMQNEIASNKLKVLAGRIQAIEVLKTHFTVSFTGRKDQLKNSIQVARIINCTGPQTDIRKMNSTLYDNMLKQGIVKSDEMNLGIYAMPDGRVIDNSGNTSESIFALGSLLKGTLWESTAVPELRIQADRVTDLLLDSATMKLTQS